MTRLVASLLTFAAAAGLLLAQEASVTTTPTPRPDKETVHANLVAGIQQAKPDLIFIGDSITENFNWRAKAIWSKYYAKRNAFNLGVSADRTQHVLWRLTSGELDGISPKVAVIMIGTNNAGIDPPAEVAAGITAIVETVRAKLPNTKILLMGIFPRGRDVDDPKRIANHDANDIISKLHDGKDVFYMDITDKFLEPDGTISKEIMGDFLHPTERGHEIWADAIEPTLSKLMGEQ